MKRYIKPVPLLLALFLIFTSGCWTPRMPSPSTTIERNQQEQGVTAIVRNQPVPDLGGYSFERDVMITLVVARNKGNVSTYSYTMTFDGRIIEVCPSRGFPLPYATQLTNPLQVSNGWGQPGTGAGNVVIGNPEPSSLYTPPSAEGTWVVCVNQDGSLSPTYWEPRIFTLPYRIKADVVLQRVDTNTSVTVRAK